MKPKNFSVILAALVSIPSAFHTNPARAAIVHFDFHSTSASGVRGQIAFDDSVTSSSQVPAKPTVTTYFGAVRSYSITNGNQSFSGSGNLSQNQINVHNNIIDVNDPFNRAYIGDGLEFFLGDGNTFLFLRFLYPDTRVLNSLALRDIFLNKAIASQAPQLQLDPSSGGAIFTLLQVSNSSGYAIQDGTYFGSDFVTTIIPEPSTILGSVLAAGILAAGSALKRKQKKIAIK